MQVSLVVLALTVAGLLTAYGGSSSPRKRTLRSVLERSPYTDMYYRDSNWWGARVRFVIENERRSRIDSSFLALEIVRRSTPRTLFPIRQSVLLSSEGGWHVVLAADWPKPEFACAIAPKGVAKELFGSCDQGMIYAVPAIFREPDDRPANASERREILADLGPGTGVFARCHKFSVSKLNPNYAMEKGCGDNERVLVRRHESWKVLANEENVRCTDAPPGVIASIDTPGDVGTCWLPHPNSRVFAY